MNNQINKFFDALINFFVNRPTYVTFVYLLLLTKIIPLFFVSIPILFDFNTRHERNFDDIASFYSVLCLVIIIPIIETFLAQYLPIVLLLKNESIQKNKWIAIVISALIFGVGHTQSLSYMFFGFGAGLVLATGYIAMLKKYNHKIAFLIISGVHAIANLISTSALFFMIH